MFDAFAEVDEARCGTEMCCLGGCSGGRRPNGANGLVVEVRR